MSKKRPCDPAVRFERAVRRAFVCVREEPEAHDCVGSWALLRAIVEQAVVDLRSADGGVLEDAIWYLVEPDGEFVSWHAPFLNLDVAAVRERAKRILVDRFGAERGAGLWARVAFVAGGQRAETRGASSS